MFVIFAAECGALRPLLRDVEPIRMLMKRLLTLLAFAALATACGSSHDDEITWSDDISALLPDNTFRAFCLDRYDTDCDGRLSKSEAAAVTEMDCSGRAIADLTGIDYFTGLTWLDCSENRLAKLDLSRHAALAELYCEKNALTSLTLRCPAMMRLTCYDNALATLDLSGCPTLRALFCDGNDLEALDLSANTALIQLDCADNDIPLLDLRKNLALTTLDCRNNPGLEEIRILYNQSILNLSKDSHTKIVKYDASGVPMYVNIPDANFKSYLLRYFDTDYDGEISRTEAAAVTTLNCNNLRIASLEGLEHFTSLTSLDCGNNLLTALDVSANTALTALSCQSNALTELALDANTALRELSCSGNALTALNVSRCTELTQLSCNSNRLSALDVTRCTALKTLLCDDNALTTLNLSRSTALTQLGCSKNGLTSLDVSSCTSLNYLICTENPDLTELWLRSGQSVATLLKDEWTEICYK